MTAFLIIASLLLPSFAFGIIAFSLDHKTIGMTKKKREQIKERRVEKEKQITEKKRSEESEEEENRKERAFYGFSFGAHNLIGAQFHINNRYTAVRKAIKRGQAYKWAVEDFHQFVQGIDNENMTTEEVIDSIKGFDNRKRLKEFAKEFEIVLEEIDPEAWREAQDIYSETMNDLKEKNKHMEATLEELSHNTNREVKSWVYPSEAPEEKEEKLQIEELEENPDEIRFLDWWDEEFSNLELSENKKHEQTRIA